MQWDALAPAVLVAAQTRSLRLRGRTGGRGRAGIAAARSTVEGRGRWRGRGASGIRAGSAGSSRTSRDRGRPDRRGRNRGRLRHRRRGNRGNRGRRRHRRARSHGRRRYLGNRRKRGDSGSRRKRRNDGRRNRRDGRLLHHGTAELADDRRHVDLRIDGARLNRHADDKGRPQPAQDALHRATTHFASFRCTSTTAVGRMRNLAGFRRHGANEQKDGRLVTSRTDRRPAEPYRLSSRNLNLNEHGTRHHASSSARHGRTL